MLQQCPFLLVPLVSVKLRLDDYCRRPANVMAEFDLKLSRSEASFERSFCSYLSGITLLTFLVGEYKRRVVHGVRSHEPLHP